MTKIRRRTLLSKIMYKIKKRQKIIKNKNKINQDRKKKKKKKIKK